jgi:hypothetical protein
MKWFDPSRGFPGMTRRGFLADTGMGFTGLALGALLFRDGMARAVEPARWSPPDGKTHFPPKAKSVIWLFMAGGVSQMESFDPKPELNKHAGKKIAETPFKATLESPKVKKRLRVVVAGSNSIMPTIYPLQIGYGKHGKNGIEVSDWWPHVAGCIDDIAVVRSMWTTDDNHGAQLQFHTGRHILEGAFPTIGSWVHYGLGSLNENLPQFVVLGNPVGECCGGVQSHGGNYLGPEHTGVRLSLNPNAPLPFLTPGPDKFKEEQKAEFDLLGQLNRISGIEYPEDKALRARIKAYELTARMQMSVPDVFRLDKETAATKEMYGLNNGNSFGHTCLVARRLVERGVRFVQVYHGAGGSGGWDAHAKLKENHQTNCAEVDKPIAGLLKDLKQRGLLKDTLVVWGTEFGRTPGSEQGNGRNHHPFGFSVWLAGGGIKGGIVHGATDELGFHAIENEHYVTDLHATVLHQLGLDPRKLVLPGRQRLEMDFGEPIKEIIA